MREELIICGLAGRQGEKMYTMKTEPYRHQMDAWTASRDAQYHALFMEMGTGKTKVAIDTMGYLYESGNINAALIVAPKGVYDNWVQNEIPRHLPDRIGRFVVRWQAVTTKAFEERVLQLFGLKRRTPEEQGPALQIFVMNVEAFSTPRGAEIATKFLTKYPNNIVIIDESTTIKNRSASRTKALMRIGRIAKYRRVLTGSPITKSPMDLFSQCLFLSDKALGYGSYFAFQARYAIIVQRKLGARSFQDIVGYRHLDELNAALEKFSTRVLKKDCLDLPDKIYLRREIALTDEQRSAYEQMRLLALVQLEEEGAAATTQSVLTQILRLQQIVCGHITTDDGELRELPSRRLDELETVLQEVQGKAIIWANWVHDIQAITKMLAKAYGADSVASYYGQTPQDERQAIVDRFQDPGNPLRFFVGQPRTGGYGITLTAANTMVYYSNSYDLEVRLQSEDRAHRIGQRHPVTYIDFVSPKTVDEKILKALREKINVSDTVLGDDPRAWFAP